MNIDWDEEAEEDFLEHYGTKRHSGRYPWGSGQDGQAFLGYVDAMRAKGLTDKDIQKLAGISSTDFRNINSIAKNQKKREEIRTAEKLKAHGYSNPEIARLMNVSGESYVRTLLADGAKEKNNVLETIVNMIRDRIDKVTYLDVGGGIETQLGISETKFKNALALLQIEGYKVHYMKTRQLGTGLDTSRKVLTKGDVTGSEVYKNRDKIGQFVEFSDDGGRTFFGLLPPKSIKSSRVSIRYKEEGGADADGVIFVRPNVKDVSLGGKSYAQVRIAVDGTHYIKGMAMYKDGLPEGVDLQFNTNKSNTGNKLDALKPMAKDPFDPTVPDKDNPFGSQIKRQIIEKNKKGEDEVTSVMNLVNEEGDWGDWSNTLSTQVLSKQSPTLAKTQLDMTYERRLTDFEEIMSLTNPTVKKALLKEFSDSAESAAIHLKAASLPRQATHVILPLSTIKPTEVYAPRFKPGEEVVLVRFPHGGTFEIPRLVVNNKLPEGNKFLPDAKDAIGIHPSVAERLSGADFDGDTVLVIPDPGGRIKVTPALEGLKNFDPRSTYKQYDGMKVMTEQQKGLEMGNISNLITDMTLKKATASEITRAVRHSMVVIDAAKHKLDYKQSAIDNNIESLKIKYQGGPKAGASTLISLKKSEVQVPARRLRRASEGGAIDPVTGKKVFVPTGESFVGKDGKVVIKKDWVKKLEIQDANTLSSGTPMERLYADHSNRLKALADQARIEMINTPLAETSPSAKKVYADQVKSLEGKLFLSLRNAPLERQAQQYANAVYEERLRAHPDMDKVTQNKVKAQILMQARARSGADKKAASIQIEPMEWEAIQAGAISDNRMKDILKNTDIDVIRSFATPKTPRLMTSTKTARAKAMIKSGATRAEVAAALGVSLTTLDEAVA